MTDPQGLLLGPGFVAPYASGRSLTSVPSTVGHLLGAGDGWRSGPLTLTGIVGVAWPTNMSRDDRLRSILDISLGLAALMVIWSLIVIPRWVLPSDPGQAAVSRADQWVLLIGFAGKAIILLYGGYRVSTGRNAGEGSVEAVVMYCERIEGPI